MEKAIAERTPFVAVAARIVASRPRSGSSKNPAIAAPAAAPSVLTA